MIGQKDVVEMPGDSGGRTCDGVVPETVSYLVTRAGPEHLSSISFLSWKPVTLLWLNTLPNLVRTRANRFTITGVLSLLDPVPIDNPPLTSSATLGLIRKGQE